MRRALLAAVAACAAACGRYADFTLPRPAAGPAIASYRWTAEPSPVLSRGAAGAWDSVDVLNPSVVRFQGQYWNLYSGFDGAVWHTGIAVSADGGAWRKQGRILSPGGGWEGAYIAANGAVLAAGDGLRYWYQTGPRERPVLGLATSADGRQWRKHGEPVLTPGPRGSWDERGVADPYVLQAEGMLYLFYLGQDRARRQRLGVARSHDGVRWEKLRANPVLELGDYGQFDENGLGEPAVFAAGGEYWMIYTGRARDETRRMGMARSADGVRWRKVPPLIAGEQAWNRAVVCDATILPDAEGRWRVWFGGGDAPRPDERVNGQIGYATLTPEGAGVRPDSARRGGDGSVPAP